MEDTKNKFEFYEKQGDEAVKRADNFTLDPPFNTPSDYHYLIQDRIPVYNEAIQNYELAYKKLEDLAEEIKTGFMKKLNQTYSTLNNMEQELNYVPFEKTHHSRTTPIQYATKHPQNEIAPASICPSLTEIDQWLCYGESTPIDLIKEVINEASSKAKRSRLIICAALLDDVELFNDIVHEEYSVDYDAYKNQKSSGMSKEDLGYKPSSFISARRVRSYAERYPEKWQSDVSLKISACLENASAEVS